MSRLQGRLRKLEAVEKHCALQRVSLPDAVQMEALRRLNYEDLTRLRDLQRRGLARCDKEEGSAIEPYRAALEAAAIAITGRPLRTITPV